MQSPLFDKLCISVPKTMQSIYDYYIECYRRLMFDSISETGTGIFVLTVEDVRNFPLLRPFYQVEVRHTGSGYAVELS